MIKGLRYERALNDPASRESGETAGWHIPSPQTEHYQGIIARVRTSKSLLPFFDDKATRFCGCVRKIGSLLSQGATPNKPAIMKQFGLAGREYNAANAKASSMIESAKTLLSERRDKLEDNVISLKGKAAECYVNITELEDRRKDLLSSPPGPKKQNALARNHLVLAKNRRVHDRLKAKLLRAETKLNNLPEKPRVFIFGKKAYLEQPTRISFATNHDYLTAHRAWRKEWEDERNCMFGAGGSCDETGGNSTYRVSFAGITEKTTNYLGKLTHSPVYNFKVTHKGAQICKFSLSQKEGERLSRILAKNERPFKFLKKESNLKKGKMVERKDTSGRIPIKVDFFRRGREESQWHIHLTTPLEGAPLRERDDIKGAIGIDTNHGHFESCEVDYRGKSFSIGNYAKNPYDINASTNAKKHDISALVRKIVASAHGKGYCVVMENLDWEGGQKSRSRTKLGATLSAMPYRKLLFKVMRECAKKGVPFRLVNAAYTSLLGNLISTANPRLSRDVAAAAIIAMRGLSPRGLDIHLHKILKKALKDGSIRINFKGQFGRHIAANWAKLRRTVRAPTTLTSDSREFSLAGLFPEFDKTLPGGAYSRGVGVALSNITGSMGSCREISKLSTKPGWILCQSLGDGRPNPREYQSQPPNKNLFGFFLCPRSKTSAKGMCHAPKIEPSHSGHSNECSTLSRFS